MKRRIRTDRECGNSRSEDFPERKDGAYADMNHIVPTNQPVAVSEGARRADLVIWKRF